MFFINLFADLLYEKCVTFNNQLSICYGKFICFEITFAYYSHGPTTVTKSVFAKSFLNRLQDRFSSDLQSRYTEVQKTATSAIKKFKEKSWEEFDCRLDFNYFSANKVFWQTIRRLRGKKF